MLPQVILSSAAAPICRAAPRLSSKPNNKPLILFIHSSIKFSMKSLKDLDISVT